MHVAPTSFSHRFTGSCEAFARVDVAALSDWILSIPFEDWPQQHRLADGVIRPAMVNDPAWFDMGARTRETVVQLMEHFPGAAARNQMISAVMSGHSIEPHCDAQGPFWLCRVHVPLTSNEGAIFRFAGKDFRMEAGTAYRVNTEVEHSVANGGAEPRVHFMFDVFAS